MKPADARGEEMPDAVLDGLRAHLGERAPPVANGEIVFEAPWQARTFGIAHALCDAGHFTWDQFRAALIEKISAWEASAPAGAEYAYWDRFLEALALVTDRENLCPELAVAAREHALAARPHGHDH